MKRHSFNTITSIRCALIFMLIIITACEKETSVTPTPPSNVNELSSKAILVSESSNQLLVEVDSTKLVFQGVNEQIDSIEVGDILASDITDIAPNGYLRKVTSIEENGGEVQIITEQAALTDAIENGNYDFQYQITENDIELIDSSGVDITVGKTANGKLTAFFKGVVVFDADGILSTTNDQIKLSGKLELDPTIIFNLDIQGFQIKDFQFSNVIEAKIELDAETNLDKIGFSKDLVLKTFKLLPITIPGPIPIPLAKQWIVIVIGVDGSVSAEITTSVEGSYTLNAGMKYTQESGWSPEAEHSKSFTFNRFNDTNAEASGILEAWLQARYEVRPFGLKSSRLFIATRPSLKLKISVSDDLGCSLNFEDPDVCLDLDACLKFHGKAQMQVFGSVVVGFEHTFYDDCFLLYSSEQLSHEYKFKGCGTGSQHSTHITNPDWYQHIDYNIQSNVRFKVTDTLIINSNLTRYGLGIIDTGKFHFAATAEEKSWLTNTTHFNQSSNFIETGNGYVEYNGNSELINFMYDLTFPPLFYPDSPKTYRLQYDPEADKWRVYIALPSGWSFLDYFEIDGEFRRPCL